MPRAAKVDESVLARVLRDQEGVISRAEALDCGMPLHQVRYRIRAGGPWQRLLPGVYLAATGTPTQQQTEIAALRYAGPGSALTGVAALRRHGVRVPADKALTVLIPGGRVRANRSVVRVWPTVRMPEFVLADGAVRFTRAARAVADASRELSSLREVRAVTADAVQRRACRLADLVEELAHAPMRQSAWLRQALAEVADGVRSVAEGDLRDLVIRARLPHPMFNARLYLGRTFLAKPDAWWPMAGVAAEVDSREWHLSPGDWAQTLARHARMTACGMLVLHFTPTQVRTEPDRVAAEIRSALQAGRHRPALGIRALPAAG
jgi:very-short-patch-repair endonuclease